MTRSPGERAEEYAKSQQMRFVDRDLKALVMGFLNDIDLTSGRRSVIRHLIRLTRIDRHEHRSQRHSASGNSEARDIWGNPWQSVDSISFVGVLHDDAELASILEHLDALRLQVPDLIDFHECGECNMFERFLSAHVPITTLGHMHAPGKELQASIPSPKLDI